MPDVAMTSGRPLFTQLHDGPTESEKHDHDFYEIVLSIRGNAIHESDELKIETRRGDVIFIRPGTWHAFRRRKDHIVMNVGFPPSLLEHEIRSIGFVDSALRALLWPTDPPGITFVHLDDEATAMCESELRAIHDDYEDRGLRSRAFGRLLSVLGILAAHADLDDPAPDRLLAARPWVGRVLELLREDYARDWRVDELAQECAVDPSHLAHTFRSVYGLPPMTYLASVRSEKAAELLLTTAMPISGVASKVGWPDANYFARRFRAYFGLSPSDFRARHESTSGRIAE